MNTFKSMDHNTNKANILKSVINGEMSFKRRTLTTNDRKSVNSNISAASMQYLNMTTHHLVSLTAFFALASLSSRVRDTTIDQENEKQSLSVSILRREENE